MYKRQAHCSVDGCAAGLCSQQAACQTEHAGGQDVDADLGGVNVDTGLILEKKGCEHVKILAQSEATLSFEDAKDPSAEASMVGGKFFTDVWDNGGREMA